MLRDLRLSLRTLARSPAYTATVILTLALGIGGATAVFSVLRSVILSPFAWAPSDRVMMIAERDSAANIRPASYPTFQDWRAGTNAFDALAFVRGQGEVLRSGDAAAERLLGAYVTGDFFRVLPAAAAVGRALQPADFAPGAPPVMAISWPLWQRRFGGDRSVIGQTVTFTERSYTVVGVMPLDFGYPTWADLWAPITVISSSPVLQQRGLHTDSRVVGRLRAGVDSAAGERALSAVARHLAEAYPAENGGWRSVSFMPVAEEILGGAGPQLRLLTWAALFVLLIACVNVAALALARAGARTRELAIRTALGGGRGALLRLLAAECVVLGVAAGAVGLVGAALLVRWLRVGAADLLPRAAELAVDPWAMAAAVALAVALVVALGLLPALRWSGPLTAALREGAGSGQGPARRRLRGALVVGQIALALMLVTGAGLLVRSLERLQRVRTGFDESRLLALPIMPSSARYASPERALQLYRDVAAAVAAVPGVQSVALTNHVPLSGASIYTPVEVEGAAANEGDQALFREVDTAYFRTAGIPILRGHDFAADDLAHPGDAVLVNQAFAARYWPGGDALGKRITVRKSAQGSPEFGQPVRATIVGVVGNVRHYSLDADFVPEVYLPYTVTVWGWMSLLVRTTGDPAAMIPAVARAAREIEPDLPLEGVSNRPYDLPDALRQTLAYRRFITGLLGAFALPALLLAALGIYGVVAYLVTQRGREIGIRIALGAQRWDVLALVVGEGMRLAGIGVLLGAAGALATTRWLRSELYETSAVDPLTFVLAAVVLTGVGLVATLLPARRAAAIDPARTLQAE